MQQLGCPKWDSSQGKPVINGQFDTNDRPKDRKTVKMAEKLERKQDLSMRKSDGWKRYW